MDIASKEWKTESKEIIVTSCPSGGDVCKSSNTSESATDLEVIDFASTMDDTAIECS